MKNLLIFWLAVSTSIAFGAVETHTFKAKTLKKLKVMTTSGDLKVSASSDDSKAFVRARKIDFDESNCRLDVRGTDNELVVKVRKEGVKGSAHCEVELDIQVPREISMNLMSGSGDLTVKGIKGDLGFALGSGDARLSQMEVSKLSGRTGSGRVEVSGILGVSDVKTGSGSIRMIGLTKSATLKTGSGSLEVEYKSSPKQGILNLVTGSGDANITLPANSKVSTSFFSGNGKFYNELGENSEASFRVKMKSGNGDLRIKESN